MPVIVPVLAPLALRDISAIYFVPFAALVVLLVERELIRAAGGSRAEAASQVLGLAAAPLLVAFLLLVLLRLNYIF